jgi:MATE family multidrug resistance protein
VGFASGKGDVTALVRAAGAALILSMAFSAVGGLLYALIPEFFASLYLDRSHPDAPAVLEFATQLVMIAGIFQLVDGLQAVGTGLLRGIKDTRIPMMIAVLSYWLVGFDLAWAFAFPLHFGGIGIWFGFVFGLATAAVLLLSRFYYKIADMKKAA